MRRFSLVFVTPLIILGLLFSGTSSAQVSPTISSVSRIWARGYQTILINGSGFGSLRAYTGDSAAIRITDTTQNWSAGYAPTGDAVTLQIASWTDRQISVRQFTGAYGTGSYFLQANDQVNFEVWNAQTLAGPARAKAAVRANATALYSFSGSPDSSIPDGGLVMDAAGSLYGFASQGGITTCANTCGTVFQLTNSNGVWSESLLYEFQGGTDGWTPLGSPVRDSAGNLYGVTYYGGTGTCFFGCGTVFEISGGVETILHTFLGNTANDGSSPSAGLVMDAVGNLYGTTSYGGSTNDGTVFELSPTGSGGFNYSVIYTFQGGAANDGATPVAALTLDAAGNLYGTSYSGGSATYCDAFQRGCGTVFELSPVTGGGWSEKVLYAFKGRAQAVHPNNAMTFDGAGNLYSTSAIGGPVTTNCPTTGCGVFFGLTPRGDGTWQEKTLFNFVGGLDTSRPATDLIYHNGIFYGMGRGGSSDDGTIYTLTPTGKGQWSESSIYSFGGLDGQQGTGKLLFGSDGTIYGATSFGGSFDNEVAFSLP